MTIRDIWESYVVSVVFFALLVGCLLGVPASVIIWKEFSVDRVEIDWCVSRGYDSEVPLVHVRGSCLSCEERFTVAGTTYMDCVRVPIPLEVSS